MTFFGGAAGGADGDAPPETDSLEFPAGHPHRLRHRAAIAVVALLGLVVAGCGGGDASGAKVDVYVAAPLCGGAKEALARHGVTAGHYKVAVRCLASSESAGRLELAVLGANSRRATEDTASVATLEPPGSGDKFSRPILESAGVPLLIAGSAREGMKQILKAVEGAGSSDVRSSVRESLDTS